MCVSRYGGGRALVCDIVGGGHLPWFLLLLVLCGGSGWRIGWSECVKCGALEIRIIDVFLLLVVQICFWTLRAALARSCTVPGSLYSRCSVCCCSDCGDGFST